MRKILIICNLLCNLSFAIVNAAEQPDLDITRTNQSSANATIQGGATHDGGVNYNNDFYSDDIINIVATISVDPSHVGQAGRIYVFATIDIFGGYTIGGFEKTTTGSFMPWNQEVADLSGSSKYRTLGSKEYITVIQSLTPGMMKLTGLTLYVYVGYSLYSDPSDIIYNSEPIILNLNNIKREERIDGNGDGDGDGDVVDDEVVDDEVVDDEVVDDEVVDDEVVDDEMVDDEVVDDEVVDDEVVDDEVVDDEVVDEVVDDEVVNDEVVNDDDDGGTIGSTITAQDYYTAYFSSYVQSICTACHTTDGLASIARLIFVTSASSGYTQTNFFEIQDFVLNITGGNDLLISKPRGVSHGGGNLLPSGSDGYNRLAELIQLILTEPSASGDGDGDGDGDDEGGDGDGDGDGDDDVGAGDGDGDGDDGGTSAISFLQGVNYLSDTETLRKAAIIMTGRLPTQTEIDNVELGGDTALRSAIRGLMSGDNFNRFIMENVNDNLLTEKFNSTAVDEVTEEWAYPRALERYYAAEAIDEEFAWYVRYQTSKAIATEPMQLVAYVVRNERPYTEILTADYIMVNPYSAVVFDADVTFSDNDDVDEWRPGSNNGYVRYTWNEVLEEEVQIATDYPHSGLLNSPVLLARYPSTSTNRNRARARWTYKFYLNVDIEALAARTTDADALADTDNPTMNNPHCTVCHTVHDPVAGAFQNYGDRGWYRDGWGGFDSLSDSYKYEDPDSPYVEGDTWYRDMRTAGFEGQTVPDADTSLQWLGQQIINDSRFAKGSVAFWYPAIFGEKPLLAPAEISDENFATRLIAFEQQDQDMEQWADSFRQGTTGYGAFNLKDLLVEMIMSNRFRANSIDNLDTAREDELTEVGMGRLLTPFQLNRKLEHLTGYTWGWYNEDGLWGWNKHLETRYNTFYGGIDSNGITERATEINTLMASVIEVMLNEVSCPITVYDFREASENQVFFPYVTPEDRPDSSSGAAAIRRNIQHLHDYLLGEQLDSNDSEIDRTYQLFEDIWDSKVSENRQTWLGNDQEICLLSEWDPNEPLQNDPNHTIHTWMLIMRYLMSDFKFLYE